jgi:hypothetical protein
LAKCPNGHENAEDQKFCGECGEPITEPTTPGPEPSATDGNAIFRVPRWLTPRRNRFVAGGVATALVVVVALILVLSGGGGSTGWSSADRQRFLSTPQNVDPVAARSDVAHCMLGIAQQHFNSFADYHATASAPGTVPAWQGYIGQINDRCIYPADASTPSTTPAITTQLPASDIASGCTAVKTTLPTARMRPMAPAEIGGVTLAFAPNPESVQLLGGLEPLLNDLQASGRSQSQPQQISALTRLDDWCVTQGLPG